MDARGDGVPLSQTHTLNPLRERVRAPNKRRTRCLASQPRTVQAYDFRIRMRRAEQHMDALLHRHQRVPPSASAVLIIASASPKSSPAPPDKPGRS